MSRIAIDLGFIQIYWYSICLLIGILVAVFLIYREVKKQKMNDEFITNMIFYGIILGLVGARAYYVLFNLDYYSQNIVEIFEFWNGGLAIHGGILVGLIWIIYYTKRYKANTYKTLDILAVGLIIAQAIGRWGNFFNQEAYGPITTLTKLQSQGLPDFIVNGMFIEGAYRVPTFLYESIWCLIGFIALLMIRKFYRYLKDGQLFSLYFIWYSIGRLIIESLRTDSLMIGPFKQAQIISVIMIIIGILIFIRRGRGSKFDNLYREENKNDIRF